MVHHEAAHRDKALFLIENDSARASGAAVLPKERARARSSNQTH